METSIDWIPAGRTFGFDELVFWKGKGSLPFNSAAARADTIVLGPHAGARFPAELQPFVDPALTRRKQYDYSDAITSPWAARGLQPTPLSSLLNARIRAWYSTPTAHHRLTP